MDKSFEIGISADGAYLYAHKFQQPYTYEIAQEVMKNFIYQGRELEILGCLIDIRGIQSVSSAADKFFFAREKAAAAQLPQYWRYAFLVDQNDDSINFIETVMRNAGYMFQIFEDESLAIDWLKRNPFGTT